MFIVQTKFKVFTSEIFNYNSIISNPSFLSNLDLITYQDCWPYALMQTRISQVKNQSSTLVLKLTKCVTN